MSQRRLTRSIRQIEINETVRHEPPERSPLFSTNAQDEHDPFTETSGVSLIDYKKLQVINFYSENPVLWTTHARKDKDKKKDLLEHLSKQIHMRPNEIQTMWRGLRVQYQANKRAKNTIWKFYDQLYFLSMEITDDTGEAETGESEPLVTEQEENVQDSTTRNDVLTENNLEESVDLATQVVSSQCDPSSPASTFRNDLNAGISPRSPEENEETSPDGLGSIEQFLRSRQNNRNEMLDLMKEIQQTVKENSGYVAGGLTFGVSHMKCICFS